jgi:hypothetical protein
LPCYAYIITHKAKSRPDTYPDPPSVEFAGYSRRWVRRRTSVLQAPTNKEDSAESADPKGKKTKRKESLPYSWQGVGFHWTHFQIMHCSRVINTRPPFFCGGFGEDNVVQEGNPSRQQTYHLSQFLVNPKLEARNPKWFDWLTILSEVDGQIRMLQILNSKQKDTFKRFKAGTASI